MADYTYSRKYKDLISQQDLLEKSFVEMFENDPRKEQMSLWLKDYKETHKGILEMADEELSDLEWDKDEEIDNLKDDVRGLQRKVNELEETVDVFDVHSLDDEMKVELFQAAMKKYSLTQLEERLGGNRFQLI